MFAGFERHAPADGTTCSRVSMGRAAQRLTGFIRLHTTRSGHDRNDDDDDGRAAAERDVLSFNNMPSSDPPSR